MKPKPKRSTREVVHVPQDVIFDHILPRIPAKSGCRFRCVSKEWHSFLTSDTFKNKHNHRDDHENNLKLLVLSKTKTSIEFTTIDCEAPPSDKDSTPTRRPLPPFEDYFDHNVYIYSLKSDSWRKVDVFQHTLHPGSPSRGTYLNENLYFLKANSSGRLDSIIRNSWTSRSAATGNGQKAHGAAAGGNAPVLGAPVWCLVIDLSTSTISSGPAQNPRNTPIANTTTSVIAMRGYGLWGGGDGKDNGNDDDNVGL
ncbi:zinc finger, CCHC-type containing protein [Tanacetum coccineum]